MKSPDDISRSTSSTLTFGGSIWPEDDPRVADALEDYLNLLRDGAAPDRSAFLARYPEIAPVLEDCLAGLELVHSAARQHVPDADSPLAQPTAGRSLAPSTVLGDYRLLRELGRGGMGIVYEAEQVSLGRRVALKVLPQAAALDPRQLQRFQIEAQAAALLHHPHIVPVFAVGNDQGLHFYAMQFIEGRTLADIVRALRESPDSPTLPGTPAPPRKASTGSTTPTPTHAPTQLGAAPGSDSGLRNPRSQPIERTSGVSSTQSRAFFRTVARLGRQAAEALEHAHGLGVLHRDIKPSNLMVDERGELWITDFGLARFQDDPGLTRTGDLVGTLRYMSPEQAGGGRRVVVDHRTDLYSLGVTLYELLTQRPAFDGQDRQDLLNRMIQDEPVAPRRLNPSIPRDLETIILKAMSKDPSSRYSSAQDLADDLGRFLDDKPILARRPGVLERAARWTRRHRTVVVTAASVLVLSLAVGTVLIWMEKQQTQKALRQLQAAHKSERSLIKLSYDAMDNVTFPLMGEAAYAGLLGGKRGEETYRRAIAFYDRIAAVEDREPTMRTMAARAAERAGYLRMILHDPRADADYQRALAIYAEAARQRPLDPGPLTAQAHVLGAHANWLWMYERHDEALDLLRRALNIALKLAEDFSDDEAIECLGSSWQLALRLEERGRKEEARQVTAQTEQLLRDLLGRASATDPSTPLHQRQRRAHAYNNLAWSMVYDPESLVYNPQLALPLAQKAVKIRSEAAIWNTLGLAYYRLGDFAKASESVSQAVQGNVDVGTPIDWLILAMIRYRQGNIAEAERQFNRAHEWLRKFPPDQDMPHFYTEAAKLLGRSNTKPPTPPRVLGQPSPESS